MRICPTPHCGRLITSGKYCAPCQHRRDRLRGFAEQRGYNKTWHAVSVAWLRKYPYCGMRIDGLFHVEHSRCVQRGIRRRADVTDHIQSIRNGGARFDPNNFQSLCNACNIAKG